MCCMCAGLAQDEEVVPEECFTAKRFNFLRWVDDDAVDEYLAAIEAEEARKRKVRERGAGRQTGMRWWVGWGGAKGCRRPSVLRRKQRCGSAGGVARHLRSRRCCRGRAPGNSLTGMMG